MKKLFIAEKPSVAKEFAKVMGVTGGGRDGYMESSDTVVTWCVGHLVSMSYPQVYDPIYEKWSEQTLPFIPETFLYEVIPQVKKQYDIVSEQLNRDDVDTIYVCTDSGREGEYIYRLVDDMAKVPDTKKKLRVWIDSQTEDEIKRGILEAKPISEYNNLSSSAYLRAKEDYLMGINFSRILSIRYGKWLNDSLSAKKWSSISVGRVMSCVLGMVVSREWEIRRFVKTPFFRVLSEFALDGKCFGGEWRVREGSKYYEGLEDYSLSRVLYKENGFKEEKYAKELIQSIGFDKLNDDKARDDKDNVKTYTSTDKITGVIEEVIKKQEKKNPPLLFNLAELQNLSSKLFKISPDETLQIVQELYERKLVTYPRTDARVLSSAVAKEISKNLNGLRAYDKVNEFLGYIAENKTYKGLEKTRYVDDSKITDHYAIIPTGDAISSLNSMSELHQRMYEVIAKRFLSIFYPPAIYKKLSVTVACETDEGVERFFSTTKVLTDEGFLSVSKYSFTKDKKAKRSSEDNDDEEEDSENTDLKEVIDKIKKGSKVDINSLRIKEGETSPPKRYNSGSMILAMENAGQLIEDEELRAQIKGSGIGTSATRAEILKKLFNKGYLKLDKKTQIITPALTGELVYGVVFYSMPNMLSPRMTAGWERGLTLVADGRMNEETYMEELTKFISTTVETVKRENFYSKLNNFQRQVLPYYKTRSKKK